MWAESVGTEHKEDRQHQDIMEITSLCLILSATLNVHPDKSQFFRYENISLNCAESGTSLNWTVRRNTSTKTSQPCMGSFGDPEESSCILKDAFPIDSGVYWLKKSDEGFYKCQHPTKGESPQSLLAVTVRAVLTTSPPHPLPPSTSLPILVCVILLFILYTVIIIVCIYAFQRWTQARAKEV
ncbi:hypothetical protein Q5P01_002871 [Channa striata]|uniref:Ig-like domain-containing protein n=1 Tax=Channa striata TaxID=64152 RepID=A0AA88NTX2_CHASR|nr:hypothetical protein Q5P01_002871 [Channa striata]